MKVYEILGMLALLALVIALPLYATWEPQRMAQAGEALQTRRVTDAAILYLNSCSRCHGPDGAGLESMPPLSNPALAEADQSALYDAIAHSPHGSVMASWHVGEKGALSGYQVEGLVTLISSAAWDRVMALAEEIGTVGAEPPPVVDLALLEPAGDDDPHECRSCHEEPAIHADRFGLNCARCHNLQAWKPALLTRHTFRLDHGTDQQLACQTCHTDSYSENTCYGCHDHQLEEMQDVHAAEGMLKIDTCIECHPTGEPGEATILRAELPSNETAELSSEPAGALHGN